MLWVLSTVRAVLAERGDNPALASTSAEELQKELDAGNTSSLPAVMTALARPTRIVRGNFVDATVTVDPSKFELEQERAMHAAYKEVVGQLRSHEMSMMEWLKVVEVLVKPINSFFDSVFVMCEDEVVRKNRLALLRDVAAVTKGVVDLSQLPGF
jgi:glycyl-tRNA synthetase